MKIIISDEIELLMQCKELEDQFALFSKEVEQITKQQKIMKYSKTVDFNPLSQNIILSDPGNLNNVV